MKAAEPKAVATPAKKNNSPFFHKESGQDFFGNTQKEQPFFSKSKNSNSFIQPKLTIGQPNDVYEKEADATADKVVQRLNENKVQAKPEKNNFFSSNKNDNVVQQKPVALISSITPLVQTKCTTCEEDEKLQKKEEVDEKDLLRDKLQKKPIFENNAEPPDEDSLRGGGNEALQRKCAECDKEDKLQKKEKEDDKDLLKGNLQKKPVFESNAEPTDDEKNIQRKCAECEQEDKVQKKPGSTPQTASPNVERSLSSSKGSGSPLPTATRTQMESSFSADFSGVRIHNDRSSAKMNENLSAQAFTHGNDIYFNEGKYNTNSYSGKHLLAHELTHTVQQGASQQSAQLNKKSADNSIGNEAQALSSDGNIIQRDILDDIGDAAGSVVDATTGAVGAAWDATGGAVVGAAADLILDQLRSLAPNLVAFIEEIRSVGIVNFFKNKLMQAVNGIFDGLQNNSERLAGIFPQFAALVSRARVIVSALASGDCKPLFAAMNELKDLVTTLAGEAWDAIVEFFQPAVDFFTDMWESFALPAIEWLQTKAGEVWAWIQQIGAQIWEWYSPVRELIGGAWDYIKGIIGLNADETGEEGLIQWAQRKAGEIWEAIKEELRPIIEPAQAMIARIQEIIPLTAILNLRQTIQDWLQNVIATSNAMGDDASNVGNEAAQTSLRDQILPAIQQSIESFRGRVADAGSWVNGKIGEVFTAVSQFFASVRSISLISFATGIIGWVETKVNELNDWVQSKVTALFDLVSEGLHNVGEFLRPIYDTLVKIFDILGNILGKLPDFLMGPLWAMLPTCIKDPIKKFFIEQILGRISFFQKLQQIENLWERLEAMAITILKQVFIDGNLRKAIWTFFSTMLDILGLPPQLVTRVIAKAAQALSDILNDPLGFLLNFIHALKLGFEQFFNNIGTHLLSGLQAWLFSKLEGTGIEMPQDFSFRSMLKLAFDIMGITVDMLLRKLEEVTGKRGLKEKIERVIGVISNAWDWFERLMSQSEEEGSIWDRLESAIGNIWDMILDGVVGWLENTIVVKAIAWIATKLDPTGVMAVITTIIDVYNVFTAILDKAREILEMIEHVLDDIGALVHGIIDAAANALERALAAAIPVALAIMSALFGLDGVVDKIKEVIQRLRQKIEDGVKKVMERIKSWVERLFALGREVVSSVAGMLGIKKEFRGEDGETHSIYYQQSSATAEIIVASTPQPLKNFLEDYINNNQNNAEKVTQARNALDFIQQQIDPLQQQLNTSTVDSVKQNLLNLLLSKFQELSNTIRLLLGRGNLNAALDKYHLEGLTGTYASMPKPRGDDFTADHQPQAAILEAAANMDCFKEAGVRNLSARASGRAQNGYAINLHKIRHEAGRTFGSKGGQTKNEFLGSVNNQTRNLSTNQEKRDKIVELIRNELVEDVNKMKEVVASDEPKVWQDMTQIKQQQNLDDQQIDQLKTRIRNQTVAGENQILSQDLDNLKN